MEEIIRLDKELFLYLNTMGTPQWDGFWTFISERTYWIPFYFVLLYVLYRNFGLKKTGLILAFTLLMVLATDQITNILKDSIQRYRPCFHEEFEGIMRAVGCERRGRFGFTSAHASNHFGIALFLGLILGSKFKWALPALLIWAAFISYSRIYLGVHFPLDVICGGMMGLLIGYGFYKFYLRISTKYEDKLEN